MKIGLSVSKCVEDLMNGVVKQEDVFLVIAGITCRTREGFEDDIIPHYQRKYWFTKPDKAKEMALWLWDENKIHQPSLDGIFHSVYQAKRDHWCEAKLLDPKENNIGFNVEYFNDIIRKYARIQKLKNILDDIT